jgi:hypothetical protein
MVIDLGKCPICQRTMEASAIKLHALLKHGRVI